MATNRLVIALLVATLSIQAVLLVRSGIIPLDWWSDDYVTVPEGTLLDISGMPADGAPGAPIVLIEFADYECPFCRQHATTVLPQMRTAFVKEGSVRYVFANYPLAGIHPNAVPMAKAAICAGTMGRYWEMHEQLFQRGATMKTQFLALASELGVDQPKFEECLEQEEPRKRIEADLEAAASLEVTSTPTFAIGHAVPDGLVAVKALISGAKPLSVFEKVINELLEQGI